jgi:adenylate kinase
MIYILTGGPATGKGTRSDILARALNIPHISTGDMLREVSKTNKDIAAQLSRGELISDETITKLLEERISREDCKKGFILDGYPRTVAQIELLNELLEKKNRRITKVIELVVSDELAFKRILERKMCEKCGRMYGIDFPSKVEDVCDDCGGKLSVRTDDTKETLKARIDTYKKNAKVILEYYKEHGLLKTVDASAHPENIVAEATED